MTAEEILRSPGPEASLRMTQQPDLATGRRFVAAHGARGALLVGVTGAHSYGFPSADSDLDLKGIHIADA